MRNDYKLYLLTALLILATALSACAGAPVSAGDGNGEDAPPAAEEGLPPVAAVKAREALAAELSLPLVEVTIVSQEQTTFTDSCLGLGGPAEGCLRADTPGWLVTLEASGETYLAHTDELGEQVRIAP